MPAQVEVGRSTAELKADFSPAVEHSSAILELVVAFLAKGKCSAVPRVPQGYPLTMEGSIEAMSVSSARGDEKLFSPGLQRISWE